MSHDVSFRRKVLYIAAIALLLYPLFRIGQPATPENPGGVLAQLRSEHNLSQANLGEIDPASESMKLATLGMRGIAANVLWEKAHEYKKKEDWNNLSATLNQITKLQPNFISVWEFQAHNLSYNISVEFDDYRHRYHWVKRGIVFLMEGTRYNAENPRLLHQIGWITGQKIGRADEHVQFRRLFREDDDFHDDIVAGGVAVEDGWGYDNRPDNWLVSRLWYLDAERAVKRGKSLGNKSPLIFYANAPMAFINYASTIEDEGILGETAQRAWRDGDVAWEEFGRMEIPTSWGHAIIMGNLAALREEVATNRKKLDALAPGARDKVYQEKVATLSREEREAFETPERELASGQVDYYYAAKDKTKVTDQEVADAAPADVREKAQRLANAIEQADLKAQRTDVYRGLINYDYWEARCNAEQTEYAVAARQGLYDAGRYLDNAELEKAKETYEQAWLGWRKIFDNYPLLMDTVTTDELYDSIKKYRQLLQQLDEEMPEDFILRDLVEMRQRVEGNIDKLYGIDDSDGDEDDSDTEGDDNAASENEPSETETPESENRDARIRDGRD
jgi:hypothetical protein